MGSGEGKRYSWYNLTVSSQSVQLSLTSSVIGLPVVSWDFQLRNIFW